MSKKKSDIDNKIFTWSRGDWVTVNKDGILYYSNNIVKKINDNAEFVTYDVEGDILTVTFYEEKISDNVFKINKTNNSFRSCAKKSIEGKWVLFI